MVKNIRKEKEWGGKRKMRGRVRVRGSWSDGLVSREQPTTEQSVSITVTLYSRHC